MPIPATTPTTLPAATIAAQRFDSWWIKSLNVLGLSTAAPVNITVTLQKYSSATGAMSPSAGDTVTLSVSNALSSTVQAQYSLLAPAVAAILAAAEQIGTAMGKL